jgi:hypothetical protein
MVESLTAIGRHFGTDKAAVHGYTVFYDALLASWRDRPVKLLEIGIGGNEDLTAGGESLRMWKEYFPHGQIVGMDIHDKTAHAEDRVHVVVGDQSDVALLTAINEEYGPFDVIVDDGSHVNGHVIVTFSALFPLLKPGGMYIVEDLQTSYWPKYGGGLHRRSKRTSMGFLKDRVDGLNYREFRTPGYVPTSFDLAIDEIRFRHNVAAILKSTIHGIDESSNYSSVGWRGFLTKNVPDRISYLARGR